MSRAEVRTRNITEIIAGRVPCGDAFLKGPHRLILSGGRGTNDLLCGEMRRRYLVDECVQDECPLGGSEWTTLVVVEAELDSGPPGPAVLEIWSNSSETEIDTNLPVEKIELRQLLSEDLGGDASDS